MIVMQFVRTSVGKTEPIDRAAKIVAAEGTDAAGGPDQSRSCTGVLVVVSGMGGVTNTLFDAAQAGLQSVDYIVWALQGLFEHHE